MPIIRPAEVDRWPRGIAYQDGFKIIGTPLGFGRTRDAKLRFLSSIEERIPRKHERILLHRALLTPLGCEHRNVDALAIDYGQKIRLGRMEIELFPAGLGPGSTQLKISFRDRQILYCGGIRSAKPLFSPPMEIPQCDLLLLDFPVAESRPTAPSRTTKEVAAWLSRQATSQISVITCGSKTAALDLFWTLRSLDIPVSATRNLFELFRSSADVLGSIAGLSRLEQALPKRGAVIAMQDQWEKSRFRSAVDSSRTAYAGPQASAPEKNAACFRFGEGEDRSGVAGYVKQTGATQVVLGRQCDETLTAYLTKAGLNVFRVTRPIQIPFPFLSRRQ